MSNDPVTIIAERLASVENVRGHHHAACEILAALNDAGFHVVRHDFASASAGVAPGEGWQKWDRGKPPIGNVEVQLRTVRREIGAAFHFRWQTDGSGWDIVAWRPA